MTTDILNDYIKRAETLARWAHRGQLRETGGPYIQHPERVAASLPPELQPIGWLHDVLEDTDVTVQELDASFHRDIVEAVVALTRRKDESYADFICRAGRNPKARPVKLADLEDNLRDCPSGSRRDKYELARLLLRISAVVGGRDHA